MLTRNVLKRFSSHNIRKIGTKIAKPLSQINIQNDRNIDKINNNSKLKLYIKDIYKYSGCGFGGSIASSLVFGGVAAGTFAVSGSIVPTIGLWLGNVGFSFYSLYKISKFKSITNNDLTEEIPFDKKKWYTMFSISNGITLAPAVYASFAISPMIFPLALTSTLGTFGGATYYALKQNNLDAIKWQAPLIGCVSGLICSSIVQIGASFMGFTQFAHGLDIISTLASTAVFTGLIIADTQKAIKDFEDKQLDSINTSVELLLDATNLLIDFIKIFTEISKNIRND
jgi:FtsH-binding integral membrane protein